MTRLLPAGVDIRTRVPPQAVRASTIPGCSATQSLVDIPLGEQLPRIC